MGRAGKINLISTRIENTPELSGLYGMLRRLSYGSLIFLITSGLIVGGIFTYLSARQQSLQTQKNTFTSTITQGYIKEGLLLAAKQRIAVIDKIMASQKHFSTLFDITRDIVAAGQLTGLSLDDTRTATLIVHVDQIRDAVALVDTLIARANASVLTKPALEALSLSKEGGFDISVSFVPAI